MYSLVQVPRSLLSIHMVHCRRKHDISKLPFELWFYKLKYHCYLKLLDSLPIFCGFGASLLEARMAVCKLAYEYLDKNNMLLSIRDEIDEPNRNMAINQLEILSRRGYFSLPIYDFKVKYDKNGNPLWSCKCHIKGEAYCFDEVSSSKKEAKKFDEYTMLMHVLKVYK